MPSSPPTSSAPTKQLDRKLGFLSVFCISLGAMMGSGIFVLPGMAAGIAGPWVALSYIVAGLLALPAVFSKAELATAMPVAGGTYVFVDRSMGPWMGTITGLGTWFSLSTKIAFALVGLGTYLVIFSGLSPLLFALGVLGAIVVVNIVGVGKASGLQIAIVFFCLICLAGLVVSGVPSADPAMFDPAFPTGLAGIMTSAAFVFVSYAGVTKIASIAEEVHHPDRNIPLGMLASQFAAMLIYAMVAMIITSHTPIEKLATDITPIATTAEAIFGPTGKVVFAVIAVIALASMANAGVLATSRKPFAMSRDDILPPSLQRVSERFGTPVVAILATGALIALLILLLPVEKLAKLASGFKIFIFTVVNLSVIILRESGVDWYQPSFKSPFYPWTQIVGILGGCWLLTSLGGVGSLGVGVAIVFGTVWYIGYAKKRVQRESVIHHLWGEHAVLAATEQAEREEAIAADDPRVIVPVFGGEPAPERLVRLAAAFSDVGLIEVMRLEEVPESLFLRSHIDADAVAAALALASARMAKDLDVDVEFHDIVTHNAKRALLDHAAATRAEWIVMEWPTRRELHYVVRHPLAWWLDHPPCDLAIFLDRAGAFDGDASDDFQKILVYANPGPHDSLLVYVADRLASTQRGGAITLLGAVPADQSDDRVRAVAEYHAELAAMCDAPCTSRLVRSDATAALAEISAEYDLLILGASPVRTLRTLLLGSLSHHLAEAARCSALLLKSPRHRVHPRLGPMDEETEEILVVPECLSSAVVGIDITARNKQELFRLMAGRLAESAGVSAKVIEEGLQARERRQNTAFTAGVALTGPTISSVAETVVGVFALSRPVDYRSPNHGAVDLVVVVLSPPGQRQLQLGLQEKIAAILRGEVAGALRGARGEAATRQILVDGWKVAYDERLGLE